ncbi:MAG: hypothetical protein RLZZ127_769 [Planctomycetota bacterium]|jgi:hypothetical protein
MTVRAALLLAGGIAAAAADAPDEGIDVTEIILDKAVNGIQVAVILGPQHALADSGRRPGRFARWPWADGEAGYALPADGWPGGQEIVWRISAELGDGAHGGRERLELLMDTAWRYGVAGAVDRIDDLRLWSADILWRPAQGPLGIVRAGGGPRQVQHDDGDASGLALTYDIEAFPAQPLVLGSRFDLGWIGGDPYGRAHLQAGISVWRVELYGGWDGIAIGETRTAGPLAGVRWRW